MVTQNNFVILCHCWQGTDRMTIMIACYCNRSRLYSVYDLGLLQIQDITDINKNFVEFLVKSFKIAKSFGKWEDTPFPKPKLAERWMWRTSFFAAPIKSESNAAPPSPAR